MLEVNGAGDGVQEGSGNFGVLGREAKIPAILGDRGAFVTGN